MNYWPAGKTALVVIVAGISLAVRLAAAADDTAVGQRPAAVVFPGNSQWSFMLPQESKVIYRGVVNFDNAGTGASGMLYPAPSPVGFLAAVVTHGILAESAKKSQKEKLQVTADEVLSPYRVVLDKFNYRDLMHRAMEKTSNGANAKLIDDASILESEIVVESTPVFSLTQDQKAIILDNAIAIRMSGATPEVTYRSTSRVVSKANDVADPTAFWTANDGEKLKDGSAQLVADSLDIAFRDAAAGAGSNGGAYKTVRYREGAAEKIERAQVLSEQCNRLLIRTLRGTYMSVPASQEAVLTSADHCGAGATNPN